MIRSKTSDVFHIFDWAGNVLNHNGRFTPVFSSGALMIFSDFEEAWEYIYKNYDEDEFQELEVRT